MRDRLHAVSRGILLWLGGRKNAQRVISRVPVTRRVAHRFVAGDRVRVQGIDAGVVEAIDPPKLPGGPVVLWLRVDERLHPLVRVDALGPIEGVTVRLHVLPRRGQRRREGLVHKPEP